MAGISIPGVTDQYKSNDTVEKLMQVERIPLTREQNQLEEYKAQKDAWREINSQLTSLRESTKTLYSYDNPFNNKLTSSTDEFAITADANRDAQLQSFKVDVIQPATCDRFLSEELPSDFRVEKGIYTYKVGEKQLSLNWRGGSLKNFSEAINKRSNGIVKSMIIGASEGKKTLLIESLQTGKENKLIFEDAAKELALSTKMISPVKSESLKFGEKITEIQPLSKNEIPQQQRMPQLSTKEIQILNEKIHVEPRGGFQISLPNEISNNKNAHITFSLKASQTEDITIKINQENLEPEIPHPGFAEFGGITIYNKDSDTLIKKPAVRPEPLNPIKNEEVLYAIMEDGSEKLIDTPSLFNEEEISFDLDLSQYQGIKSIAIKNNNTAYKLELSAFSSYDSAQNLGFRPNNPVSEAQDAIIKYEGIKITRPTNKIDDVIPDITLNIHDKTEKTATIKVEPNKESSKNALIEFVGKYNQVVAKINILSQNKNEIIEELDYLTDEEKDEEREKLGMFQTDFSLTSIKSNMQTIISSGYNFSNDATINMLSQIGIATNATGYSNSYSQSRLRGYLEIDEKKLDSALEENLDDIKALFGYDSDGDLIVDSGIAYKLDKQITAYTQTGGILALKTSTLDSKIKNSESKIARLEDQMDDKEAQLRSKYSQMEGTLSSLESQQNAISNFTKQQSKQ